MRNVYKITVGKCKGKRLLGRPRRRLENKRHFEMVLKGIGWKDVH
jgi:hypothetical protein